MRPLDRGDAQHHPDLAGQPLPASNPHAAAGIADVRIDLSFPIDGPPVPLDHGYLFYSALSELRSPLHGAGWLAVHPLHGDPQPDGTLLLTPGAALRLRIPPSELPPLLSLSGQTLSLHGRELRLGLPQIHVLVPAAALEARLVTIKGFTEPGPFRTAVQRQLVEMAVRAQVRIGRRRVVEISGRRVVGFGVRLGGLAAEDSLRVQYLGIGGRQRMGCGIFVVSTDE